MYEVTLPGDVGVVGRVVFGESMECLGGVFCISPVSVPSACPESVCHMLDDCVDVFDSAACSCLDTCVTPFFLAKNRFF